MSEYKNIPHEVVLRDFPLLEEIDFGDNPFGFKSEVSSLTIENLTKLRTISLFSSKLSSLEISRAPYLRYISLQSARNLGRVQLANLPELREIYAPGSGIRGLKLANLPKLTLVDLEDTSGLTDELVFFNLPNLQELKLAE